jgi:hypothetical protein
MVVGGMIVLIRIWGVNCQQPLLEDYDGKICRTRLAAVAVLAKLLMLKIDWGEKPRNRA